MLRRIVFFAALAVLLAGCGAGQVVGPTPNGKLIAPPVGNKARGKVLFQKNACANCHTFTPAGSTAKIGPDLDNLAAYAQRANESLADFTQAAIIKPPPPYVPPGFPTNAMPTTFGSTLSSQEIADLVAFLTKS